MLSNLTIALLICLAEAACLAVLALWYHTRLHAWLQGCMEEHGTAPATHDVKELAEGLVAARQTLMELAAAGGDSPANAPLIAQQLEQVGYFSAQIAAASPVDSTACMLALEGIRKLAGSLAFEGQGTAKDTGYVRVIDSGKAETTGAPITEIPANDAEKQDEARPTVAEDEIEALAQQMLQHENPIKMATEKLDGADENAPAQEEVSEEANEKAGPEEDAEMPAARTTAPEDDEAPEGLRVVNEEEPEDKTTIGAFGAADEIGLMGLRATPPLDEAPSEAGIIRGDGSEPAIAMQAEPEHAVGAQAEAVGGLEAEAEAEQKKFKPVVPDSPAGRGAPKQPPPAFV